MVHVLNFLTLQNVFNMALRKNPLGLNLGRLECNVLLRTGCGHSPAILSTTGFLTDGMVFTKRLNIVAFVMFFGFILYFSKISSSEWC